MPTKLDIISEAKSICKELYAASSMDELESIVGLLDDMGRICSAETDSSSMFADVKALMDLVDAKLSADYPKDVSRLWELLASGQAVKCGGGV